MGTRDGEQHEYSRAPDPNETQAAFSVETVLLGASKRDEQIMAAHVDLLDWESVDCSGA
jgi:hypothetical protein